MKCLYLVLGIVLMVVGMILTIAEPLTGMFLIVFGLFILYLKKKLEKNDQGKWTFKDNKKADSTNKPEINLASPLQEYSKDDISGPVAVIDGAPKTESSPAPPKKHFYFNVVGISKENDEKKDIQRLIENYVAEHIELEGYGYEGMTNKEILEYGEDVYETNIYGWNEIKFEAEPDNPYDPNAVKVIHVDIGHIGYVPKEYTSRVAAILDKEHEIEWRLVGGKLKYIDYDEGKVRIKTLKYGVTIDISTPFKG